MQFRLLSSVNIDSNWQGFGPYRGNPHALVRKVAMIVTARDMQIQSFTGRA